MSTLRINNIEAQSVPASPTIDEKVKVTNSSGDILVNIDGKTSGITTIGINTTDGNIKFDANSNVLITGILTATTLAGNFTPDSLEIGSNIKLGNAGVITATSFSGSGANLTGLPAGVTINNNATTKFITGTNNATELDCEANLSYNNSLVTFASSSLLVSKRTSPTISVKETAGNKEGAFRANTDGVLLRTLGNYPLIFHTNQTERAQIDGSGRFLIGTNSVYNANSYSKNLIIYENGDAGASIIGNASSSNYASLYLTDTTTAIKGYLEAQLGVNGNFTIGANGSGPIRFTNNGSERLRIDGSGNVMIGMTNGSKKFSVRESSTSSGVYYNQLIGGSSHLTGYAVGIGFDPEGYPARNKIAIVAEGVGAGYSKGKLHFLVNDAANSSEATLSDAAMTIYETGQVGINRDTTPLNGVKLMVQNPSNNVFYAYHEGTGNNYTFLCRNDRASGSTQATQIIFLGSGNTYVGDIRSTGSATSYNTSSDYRLKENVTTISDGITRLKTLKPSRFNFISNPSQTVDGFLAHEVTAVPEAISGTKDEVVTQTMIDNGDAPSDSKLNDPIYQQIDQAKLVPLLTAALQEAVAKIETLESKVAALEGS